MSSSCFLSEQEGRGSEICIQRKIRIVWKPLKGSRNHSCAPIFHSKISLSLKDQFPDVKLEWSRSDVTLNIKQLGRRCIGTQIDSLDPCSRVLSDLTFLCISLECLHYISFLNPQTSAYNMSLMWRRTYPKAMHRSVGSLAKIINLSQRSGCVRRNSTRCCLPDALKTQSWQ